MKKLLFVSVLFLFSINQLFAQSTPKNDSLSFVSSEKKISVQNNTSNDELILEQIEKYKINFQGDTSTFNKRKSKTKRKFKSKYGSFYLNFAEHVFRTFIC